MTVSQRDLSVRDFNIVNDVRLHARLSPGSAALQVGATILSYAELAGLAGRLGGAFSAVRRTGRIGILASRSVMACVGILGAAWSGGTYVPLSLKLPEGRLVALLQRLELDALVVDGRGAAMLTPAVLAAAPALVVLADDAKAPERAESQVAKLDALDRTPLREPVPVGPEHVAYIEFTSGSTGVPKGVMVPSGAVIHYLDVMQNHMRIAPADRAAETCDITFDLSVHNMFLAWRGGAALHVMTPLDMVGPAQFIRKHAITTWLSVPSIIAQMRRTGTLKPGLFPGLRWSLFCGEPLPLAAAEAWAEAAPNSILENHYGPTEATIACLFQRLTSPAVATPSRGIVAIGAPYREMQAAILDERLRSVPPGTAGELALSGPQLATGYFGEPELTASRFPSVEGRRWYLTGDLAMADQDGVFHHLGRLDNQVKIQGNRVELEEIEMHLRAASGADLVAAVPWPLADGLAAGVVGFAAVSGAAGATGSGADACEAEGQRLRKAVAARLPAYMVPSRIHLMGELPLNGNGKVDRKALLAWLEAEPA